MPALQGTQRRQGKAIAKKQLQSGPPDGARRIGGEPPVKLELGKGEHAVGTLIGQATPGQYGQKRTMLMVEGPQEGARVWVPNQVAWDEVIAMPAGTRVWVRYNGESKTASGRTMQDWELYELPSNGQAADNDDLPF